ncbi:sterol desaturase family protein [Pelomonas sp. APW6]|uniref:Sterol desaturase family protein n=1 Tax=Roseateles subflavus TaxID=3053353 RepID=A0ABT7LEG7_9BURK|nr:sterol desaturase family protein [Pelomonas sp. APW6]MDL5031252.1 sterol desaturase family protein [Pelomonas sp. APW6]
MRPHRPPALRFLSIEPGLAVYRADFLFYAIALTCLALALLTHPMDAPLLGWVMAGAAAWTLLEYLLHRFVLHGLSPFRDWHAEHHGRPDARISAPTLLTAGLFTLLLLPMGWWMGRWPALALGFGLLAGYFCYAVIHHVLHRPLPPTAARPGRSLLRRQRRWHARHHQRASPARGELGTPGHYGVTSAFWDHIFRTGDRPRPRPRRAP